MTERVRKRSATRSSGSPGLAELRSVLVPIDLTPISDRVLGRLALLPLAGDARVTILHVVPGSLPALDRRAAASDAARVLASEERHLRKALPRNVSIQPLVKHGAAAREIGAHAKKVKAELVVMGRGGGRALRDTFLGSTAERVVRQAQLPVLVVRLPPRALYSRPALAADLDQSLHDVVRLMLRVLPRPRPRVEVVHAFDVPYRGPIYPSLTEANKKQCQVTATRTLVDLLAHALAKANVEPGDAPRWKFLVRYGSPGMVVDKVMRAAATDLLVLGTHGYSGAAYMFLGTVAGELLRRAQCDVLVVPPARSVD